MSAEARVGMEFLLRGLPEGWEELEELETADQGLQSGRDVFPTEKTAVRLREIGVEPAAVDELMRRV